MFLGLLVLALLGAVLHLTLTRGWNPRRAGELLVVYVLVGYCGIPMAVVAIGTLLQPDRAAAVLNFPAGNPFQTFLGWAYLGMALTAILAWRYRGNFLVAPALLWSIFFLGATGIHMGDPHGGALRDHADVLGMLATHLGISLLLLGGIAASGAWRPDRQSGPVSSSRGCGVGVGGNSDG